MANQNIIDLNAIPASSSLLSNAISVPLGSVNYPFVAPFGSNNNPIAVYPNDAIQLDVFNAIDTYLETGYRITTFNKSEDVITVYPEKDVSDLGYISGKYKINYKFQRNYLGSGDAHRLQIQEISADGLEVRVLPANVNLPANVGFIDFFATGFFQVPKSQVLPNLFLYKDANTAMRVFDYVQDRFTFPDSPYSIIFKLNVPVPDGVVIGDFLWLSQQVSDTVADEILIIPPKTADGKTYIAGPNWDALTKNNTSVSSNYQDWDDLLSTNTQTSQDLINKLLSGSLIEGIPLNIDYRSFENYITFGSATERLYNFHYKMQLLENYDARIKQLTTDLQGLPSSSVSSSTYFQNNVIDAQTKRAALIGSFDGYEKYLYYESSSYVTNSFGEYYPTTWPKSNSTKPYTNYSSTSSQAVDWFDGIITSASLYDQNNINALYKLIPNHVQQDEANEEYILFVNMIGHYFDLMYAYVQQITATHKRDESLLEGFSKDLVYHVSKNLGVDFENGNSLEELWKYTLGTDSTGSYVSTYGYTTEDKTKETWKRIISNLPYLLKTKGTERGVRALISCFGLPQTILRIREYGGAEPEFDSKTDWVYDRFNYALSVGYATASYYYYNSGSYNTASYANSPGTLRIPWKTLENGLVPMSTQLRVKMKASSSLNQIIMEVPNQWHIKTFKSASGDYIGFFLSGSAGWASSSVSSSIYDGTFHSVTLLRTSASDASSITQTYNLVVKKTNYEKVVSTHTASLTINGTTSGSYNTKFATTGTLWIPSSASTIAAPFSGSIQEFRFWTTTLQDSVLDNHALAPTSFQGNTDGVFTGSTSSFYDLSYRLCLGSDNNKINFGPTYSFNSQHPNQESNTFGDGSAKIVIVSSTSSSIYTPVVEIHSLEWPDLGSNRSVGNKIRIDDTFTVDTQLYTDTSVVRAVSDNNPIDSPRLGVFLSPTNEVNQDIAEQFGGISIDDYIGDPSYLSLDHYPGLDELKREYLKKYNARVKQQNYIRLLRYYDAALFKLIKKFVPYRANTQVGLVVESDILHRTKLPTNTPSWEDLQYTSSIVLPETLIPGGFVQDGDGEPFRNSSGYVSEGVINSSKVVGVSGEEQPVRELTVIGEGTNVISILDLDGSCNEYNNQSVEDNPTSADSLIAQVVIGETSYGRNVRLEGSKYVFMTYNTSGSGATASLPYLVTSSRYDYSEPYSPTILHSKLSEVANDSDNVYDVNIFGKRAFKSSSFYLEPITSYTASSAIYKNKWTSEYGLRILSTTASAGAPPPSPGTPYDFTSEAYWGLDSQFVSGGLFFTHNAAGLSDPTGSYTGSCMLPAFFYNPNDVGTHNYIYEVTIDVSSQTKASPTKFEVYFGNMSSPLTQSLTISSYGSQAPITFITKATGPYIGFKAYSTVFKDTPTIQQLVCVHNLSVKCLNYRAEVQDFHLRDSYGMRNARYDGCKITSTDWNTNSPDTIDGGPAVVVTVGGGKQLSVKPNTRGNFKIQ